MAKSKGKGKAKEKTKRKVKKIVNEQRMISQVRSDPTQVWAGLLGQLGSAAISMAPALLPMLLARGVQQGKFSRQDIPTSYASAPLAAGMNPMIGSMTGVMSKSSISRGGRVMGEKVVCLDFFDSLSAPDSGAEIGDVLMSKDLNLVGDSFKGTRIREIALTYERFKIKRQVFIIQPTAPATEAGYTIGACFSDPKKVLDVGGATLVKELRSTARSSEAQVWNDYMIGGNTDPNMLFYSDPSDVDLVDERWTSSGRLVIAAGGEISPSLAIGDVYVLTEAELDTPTLIAEDSESNYAALAEGVTDQDADLPFGTPTGTFGTDELVLPPAAANQFPPNEGNNIRYILEDPITASFCGFLEGRWQVSCTAYGTGTVKPGMNLRGSNPPVVIWAEQHNDTVDESGAYVAVIEFPLTSNNPAVCGIQPAFSGTAPTAVTKATIIMTRVAPISPAPSPIEKLRREFEKKLDEAILTMSGVQACKKLLPLSSFELGPPSIDVKQDKPEKSKEVARPLKSLGKQ